MNKIEFCASCKDDITEDQNYVFYKNKYYHLECFLEEHGLALEVDEDTIE